MFKKNSVSLEKITQKKDYLEKQLQIVENAIDKILSKDYKLVFPDWIVNFDEQNNLSEIFKKIIQLNSELENQNSIQRQKEWINLGSSQLVDLLNSKNNQVGEDFYSKILKFVINYIDVNQGGMFVIDEEHENHLVQVACYAYNKQKYFNKKIAFGQGLVGQCFLEGEITICKEVPQNYVSITSGLGYSTPNYLILLPLIYDKRVIGVIELASFGELEQHKIEFLEKISENIASLVYNTTSSKKLEKLLLNTQEKSELLQQQEEELKQNIEELQSNQEQTSRQKIEIEQQSLMLRAILDNIPFPIFVKDENGKYLLVNKAQAQILNSRESEIIGKTDANFIKNYVELLEIQKSDRIVVENEEMLSLPLQSFSTTDLTYIFKTTKIPLRNLNTNQINVLGISIDLSDKLTLEKRLLNEKTIHNNNILLDLTGRQRMLSQKIGFHVGLIANGKLNSIPILRKAIDLHDISLKVIKNGGVPPEIDSIYALTRIQDSLLPIIYLIEEAWSEYKKEAENILLIAKNKSESIKSKPFSDSFDKIEIQGENVLLLNDRLVQEVKKINKKLMIDTFK